MSCFKFHTITIVRPNPLGIVHMMRWQFVSSPTFFNSNGKMFDCPAEQAVEAIRHSRSVPTI